MNIRTSLLIALAATLAACASAPQQNTALDQARDRYAAAQGNTQVSSRARAELESAAESLRRAEQALADRAPKETVDHLAYMTKQKVVIAEETASSLVSQEIVAKAAAERDQLRLSMRTAEADAARRDLAAAEARERDLQRQLEELDAKKTDRGMVLTLGDVLFATNESELKGGALVNLGKLASFLNEYQDRTVIIEGHTDSVGSEDYNLGLSQRRANSVRSYLMSQGVAANRLSATGMGKGYPVASNDTATGRQQNRRVEVIIANETTASH